MQQVYSHFRHDFSAEVKSVLARRVAQHCSLCGQATSGPQADPRKTINIGVAAHITAAAPGGPRYDASLAPEERSSPENGIWLCQSCGKLVDSDSERYSVPLLRNLKRIAEAKVLAALENRSGVAAVRAEGASPVPHLADVESKLNKYLIAHRQYCSHLPYLCLGLGSLSKALEDVYIPVRLRRLSSSRTTNGSTSQVMIGDILLGLDRHSILISGPPGAGKSTVLRQIGLRAWHNPELLGLQKPFLTILVQAADLAKSSGSLETRLRTVISDEYALDQDLPEGFLNDWAEYTNTKWLILIDGLDHIPGDKRVHFLMWLASLDSTTYHVVLSCRSQATDLVESISSRWPCARFEICSLTLKEAVELASNWVTTSITEFQDQFKEIRDPVLRETPLFATAAALVFHERGTLPSRRTQVYERFIAIALEAARERGVEERLHVRLARSLELALAMAAAILTMGGRAELDRLLGRWIESEFGLARADAQEAGAQFLQVMSEQSGLVYRVGKYYDFVHPTLQQYLCAKWFIRRAGDQVKRVKGIAKFLLLHPTLPECSGFFVGVLSNNASLSDAALQGMSEIARQRNWFFRFSDDALKSLYYSLGCLLDGAIASDQTRNRILRQAINVAGSNRTDFSIRVVVTARLIALGEVVGLREVLLALFRDHRGNLDGKAVIVECLTKLRASNDLVAIACDAAQEKSIRLMAASGLVLMRDVASLVEIMGGLGPKGYLSEQVFSDLSRLGPSDELRGILVSPTSSEIAKTVSSMMLSSLGHTKVLFAIVCDDTAPRYSRFCSLPLVLRDYSRRRLVNQLAEPRCRGRLLVPSLALLIHFRNQWQKTDWLPGAEVMQILRNLLMVAFGRRSVLREDGSNARSLLDEAIAMIQNELSGNNFAHKA